MDDDMKIGVNVASGTPGVTPTAFVAIVEVIDTEGEKRYVTIESAGLSDARRAAILGSL